MKGKVFEIQHFSVDDGPGIRTMVFLKGCQMQCLWCHNPESILTGKGEFSFAESRCVGCGTCFKVCPNGCHRIENGKHVIDRERCTFCGKCINLCAGRALSMIAADGMEAVDVIRQVLQDKTYYEESGGGMTISGGEPMMQADFVAELAGLARKNGIHVAMESNGNYSWEHLCKVKDLIDLFLIDWKITDPEVHKFYTGMSNELTASNIRRLHDEGKKVLVRCPIIPGVNDNDEHFRAIAEMTQEMPGLLGAELMPYHDLGVSKIQRYGLDGKIKYMVATPPDAGTKNAWIDRCRSFGGRIINLKDGEEEAGNPAGNGQILKNPAGDPSEIVKPEGKLLSKTEGSASGYHAQPETRQIHAACC